MSKTKQVNDALLQAIKQLVEERRVVLEQRKEEERKPVSSSYKSINTVD